MENNEKLSVEKLLEYRDFYNGLAEANYNKNNHFLFEKYAKHATDYHRRLVAVDPTYDVGNGQV